MSLTIKDMLSMSHELYEENKENWSPMTPEHGADGISLVSAMFGSFSSGPPVTEQSAVSDVSYASQVSATDLSLQPFRTDLLGPGADISIKLPGVMALIDFSQKMVNEQTQELSLIEARLEDEQTLRDILENQFLDESGVNIDEELASMITIQTAFSAAARVVTAVDDMFQELLRAV